MWPGFDRELYLQLFFHSIDAETSAPLDLGTDDALRAINLIEEKLCAGVPEGRAAVFVSGDSPEAALASMTGSAASAEDDDAGGDDVEFPTEGPCGHSFEPGEGVYHCRTCALDGTCVFCSRCFHASTHDGHDTTFSLSSGNGGCCDCGDPEAWRIQPDCKYHSTSKSDPDGGDGMTGLDEPISEIAATSMRTTIATVLDFVVDILARAPSTLEISDQPDWHLAQNPADEFDRDGNPVTSAGGEMDYVCVLWNDESHSFEEVIRVVHLATSQSREFLSDLATRVDAIGRDIVSRGKSIMRLMTIGRAIAVTGLAVSIRSVKDYSREALAGVLVQWLRSLIKRTRGRRTVEGKTHASVAAFITRTIGELLCSPRRRVHAALGGAVMEYPSLSSSQPLLRLDHLISMECKFWKKLRLGLRELFISTLIMTGEELKMTYGLRFALNYVISAESFVFEDREKPLNILHSAVQLFTVPTIANHLVSNTRTVEMMLAVLKGLLLAAMYPTGFNAKKDFFIRYRTALLKPLKFYRKLLCDNDYAVFKASPATIIGQLHYLVGTPNVVASLMRESGTASLRSLINLLCMLQGMNPQKRELTSHIVFENGGWIHAFNLSYHVSTLIDVFTDAYAPTTFARAKDDFEKLRVAIRLVCSALDGWCLGEQAFERSMMDGAIQKRLSQNPEFVPPSLSADGFSRFEYVPGQRIAMLESNVFAIPISLHYPLQWLLASLLSLVPQYLSVINSESSESLKSAADLFDFDSESAMDVDTDPLDSCALIPLEHSPSGAPNASTTPAANIDLSDLPEEEWGRVPPGFKEVSKADRIARIIEYPVRVCSVLAQIRARLWIRNGLSIRDQANNFRYNFLRDVYDQGIFLLQNACVVLGADRLLTIVLCKFGVREWFLGNTRGGSSPGVNPPECAILAEDVLELIITVLTERSIIMSSSLEFELRREFIHRLALHPGGLPFSKITEQLPARLSKSFALKDDPTVVQFGHLSQSCREEELLKELATFKFPENASDTGMYELKESFYGEVDSWFYHYNPSQQAKADGILAARASKLAPSLKKDVMLRAAVTGIEDDDVSKAIELRVRPPKIIRVTSHSGYSSLEHIVGSLAFLRILFFTIYNTTKSEEPVASDRALSAAVYLLIYALESEIAGALSPNLSFLKSVGEVSFRVNESRGVFTSTLVHLVLDILNRSSEDYLKDHVDRLSYFILQLSRHGGHAAKSDIASWQEENQSRLKAEEAEGAARRKEEAKRRKEEAKKRQAALMNQLSQQQKDFMDTYANDEDFINEGVGSSDKMQADIEVDAAPDSVPNERQWAMPGGNCIMCQEILVPGSSDYGMLSMMQCCRMEASRFVDFEDVECVQAIASSPNSLDIDHPRPAQATLNGRQSGLSPGSSPLSQRSAPALAAPLKFREREPDIFASTCGHLMHMSCFDVYLSSIETKQNSFEDDTILFAEDLERGEFLCPLCRTLGNCCLPVIGVSKREFVNWAGSTIVGGGISVIPAGKGGSHDAVSGLSAWLDGGAASNFITTAADNGKSSASVGPTGDRFEGAIAMQGEQTTVSSSTPSNIDRALPSVLSSASERLSEVFRLLINSPAFDLDTHIILTVANTICGLERAQRGICFKKSGSFRSDFGRRGLKRIDVLESLSQGSITLLNVLSDLCQRFARTASSRPRASVLLQDIVQSIFHSYICNETLKASALASDPFKKFVALSMLSWEMEGERDAFSLLSIFWVLEVVRTLVALLESCIQKDKWTKSLSSDSDTHKNLSEESTGPFAEFCDWILMTYGAKESLRSRIRQTTDFRLLNSLCAKLTLPFLRKSAIFMHVRYGIVPPSGATGFGYENPAEEDFKVGEVDEFEHLSKYLRLPNLTSLCSSSTISDAFLSRLIGGWLDPHLGVLFAEDPTKILDRSIILTQPTPFELIQVPTRLEALLEESFKKVCKTCKRTILEPSLCLLCGYLLCQRCNRGEKGECNTHMKECGGEIGIFLLIRKFRLLYLHAEKGALKDPPYIDSHGEVDVNLRNGRMLFLHQVRYDEIRRLWLNNRIPNVVATFLEHGWRGNFLGL